MCFAQQIHARSVDYFLFPYENVYVGLFRTRNMQTAHKDEFYFWAVLAVSVQTQEWSQPLTEHSAFLPQEFSLFSGLREGKKSLQEIQNAAKCCH